MFSYQPKVAGQHIATSTQPDIGRNGADVEDLMLDGKIEGRWAEKIVIKRLIYC
jgi:hypothetical protein